MVPVTIKKKEIYSPPFWSQVGRNSCSSTALFNKSLNINYLKKQLCTKFCINRKIQHSINHQYLVIWVIPQKWCQKFKKQDKVFMFMILYISIWHVSFRLVPWLINFSMLWLWTGMSKINMILVTSRYYLVVGTVKCRLTLTFWTILIARA